MRPARFAPPAFRAFEFHRDPTRGRSWRLILALVALGGAPDLAAQQPGVSGLVTEGEGRPAVGVVVTAEDEEERPLRAVLTDELGHYRLLLPRAGTYRLRLERIGYEPTATETFQVGPGDMLQRDVHLETDPIRLEALEVRAEGGRCSMDPGEASSVGRLWSQARQAFRRVDATETEAAYRFGLRHFDRETEILTGRVLRQAWVTGSGSSLAFRSPPVEDLVEEGWVRLTNDRAVEYFGPDLHVLLSDTFVGTHCFALREDPERPDLVGLAFEPQVNDRPAIRGIFWMNRRSAELRSLRYHYTRHLHSPRIPDELLELFGGEAEFRVLPDGRWVVERWVLRMPGFSVFESPPEGEEPEDTLSTAELRRIRAVVDEAPTRWRRMIERRELVFLEQGGEVAWIETPAGDRLATSEGAVVEGVVWDSLRVPPAPLPDARVRVEGTDVEVASDSLGRFRIAVPTEGIVRLLLSHPRLDTLELAEPIATQVRLRDGVRHETDLALPSSATLQVLQCGRVPGEG